MKMYVMCLATASILANFLYAQDDVSTPLTHLMLNEKEVDSDSYSYPLREISTENLYQLVEAANPLVMIVDARGIKTDNGKRIPGAKTIPLDASIENITANLPDKEAMIIVYCSNKKCSTSGLMADRLIKMGYKNVWKYSGGIEEWEATGQKIEKGKKAADAAAQTGPKSA